MALIAIIVNGVLGRSTGIDSLARRDWIDLGIDLLLYGVLMAGVTLVGPLVLSLVAVFVPFPLGLAALGWGGIAYCLFRSTFAPWRQGARKG